jgi:hypothetical protein
MNALGIEKADLVGNDSGGAIAQIFAAHYPVRIPTKSAMDSERRRPSIPIEAGQGFR